MQGQSCTSQLKIIIKRLTFQSQSRNIHMDVFRLPAAGKRPVILVLHGSAGSHDCLEHTEQLAMRGYIAVAPHYLESTGTSWADVASIQRHGWTWGKTIINTVQFVRQLPYVDDDCIGLLGFSLGAYLAVAVASQDPSIKCIVEFFGGIPLQFLPSIEHLPPTLILHGEEDRIVPTIHAIRLKQFCEEKKFPCEMSIYPHAGHRFSATLMAKAMARAMGFFDRHMAGA
jgi:dipeptidyl aminopeptidase/acylaminoacyl peptidase